MICMILPRSTIGNQGTKNDVVLCLKYLKYPYETPECSMLLEGCTRYILYNECVQVN